MPMQLTLPRSTMHWSGLLLAGASAAAGLGLSAHYPLQPLLASIAWLLVAALAWRFWQVWPLLLPALVPLLGFAPWTGWITFEELDLLVLASAAGGYAALALGARADRPAPAWQRPLGWSGLSRLLLLLFAVSLGIALWRGFEDAGGFVFGWYQGYHEAMNSWRAVKSFFLVLLLLPLWRAAASQRPAALQDGLTLAMGLALAGASLAAVWERLAYTGLLNFSTDYRTTGMFWEMHVGGAALDGCLALTLPFVVAAAMRERRSGPFLGLMALVLLGAYAALTTFSRGVYLALPLGAALTLLLQAAQNRRGQGLVPPRASEAAPAWRPNWPRRAVLAVLLTCFALAAWPLFRGGGYRALLALGGSLALLLAMPPLTLRQTRGQHVLVLAMALLLASLAGAFSWAVSQWLPKMAYVLDACAVLGGLALAWWLRAGVPRQLSAGMLAAAWFWSLAGAAVVTGYWGSEEAMLETLLPLLLWALAWAALQVQAPPEAQITGMSWRSRSIAWVGGIVVLGVLAGVTGGAYIGDRMATGQRDLETRLGHWKLGLGLLHTPTDWLLGQGAGRFVPSYYFAGPDAEHVGDYRLRQDGARQVLAITSGRHELGWGEVFRVSQRVAVPQGQVMLEARLRADKDVSVHFEICEKHLLYNQACLIRGINLKAKPGVWQTERIDMGVAPAMGGAWWAPRMVSFSVGLLSRDSVLEIGSLSVQDASGAALLANGDFSEGMARWFFSSDRYHLPWHIKSLPLHILFEQGLVGLGLAALLLLAALWRCTGGHARHHALAPALAGSLLGFVVVGLFDSLIDAPRIGFLFFAVLALALGLRAVHPPRP